jgi:hypothetical protein
MHERSAKPAGLFQPRFYVRPVPDHSLTEVGDRPREIEVPIAPVVNDLRSRESETVGDLRCPDKQIEIDLTLRHDRNLANS